MEINKNKKTPGFDPTPGKQKSTLAPDLRIILTFSTALKFNHYRQLMVKLLGSYCSEEVCGNKQKKDPGVQSPARAIFILKYLVTVPFLSLVSRLQHFPYPGGNITIKLKSEIYSFS